MYCISKLEELVTGFCVQYLHHQNKGIIQCIIFSLNGDEGVQISNVRISTNYMDAFIAIASKSSQTTMTATLANFPDVINYFRTMNPNRKEFCNTMTTIHNVRFGTAVSTYKYLKRIHQNPEGIENDSTWIPLPRILKKEIIGNDKQMQRMQRENDTTRLEKEIIYNEKLYCMLSNDTTILENEIIRNEEIWRKYVTSLPRREREKLIQNNDKYERSHPNYNNDRNDSNKNEQRKSEDEKNKNEETYNENNDDNKDDNKDDSGHNNNNNNGNRDGDEKKNNDDEDQDEKKDDGKANDEEESYDMDELKQKMKTIKVHPIYIKIKNTKHALNDNQLMAVMYYCDSKSACAKMKKAHRCIIKDEYWKETYYHCTNAIEKIYQVLHYKNDEWKQSNDMSQKLYHGSTINILSAYDKEQFFSKTMISVSTKDYIAIDFAANKGMIFIIDKGFHGLYEGKLRGANVQWLSTFEEYEYIILPTTYNKINEFRNHGLSLRTKQNVYITCYFKTNNNPLLPHSDTVSDAMCIDYTGYATSKYTYNKIAMGVIILIISCIIIYIGLNSCFDSFEYIFHQIHLVASDNRENLIGIIIAMLIVTICILITSQTQWKTEHEDFDVNVNMQRRRRTNRERRRGTVVCDLNGCDFEHHDTIPSTQLNINIFNTAELQHIKKCHLDFYRRLKIWTQPKWEEALAYFIQITCIDLVGFNIQLTMHETNNSATKYFVKEIGPKDNESKMGNTVRIKKGQQSGDTEIQLDEKRNEYYLALYDNKKSKHPLPNSNVIHLITENDSCVPPQDMNYKPKCIDLSTVRITKDDKNKNVNIYWDIPLYSFGEISYKITIDDKQHENLTILPYSIPFPLDILSFTVTTIAIIDDKVYESEPSKCIIINVNDQEVL